jgi:hypothetical protein
MQADSFVSDRSSSIGIILNAILSDVADEQKHFNKSPWQAGLESSK